MKSFNEFFKNRIDEVHEIALQKLGLTDVLNKLRDKKEIEPKTLDLLDYAKVFRLDKNGKVKANDFYEAFRKLAKQYHPDRGGDEDIMTMYNDMIAKFKESLPYLKAAQREKRQTATSQEQPSYGLDPSRSVYRTNTQNKPTYTGLVPGVRVEPRKGPARTTPIPLNYGT